MMKHKIWIAVFAAAVLAGCASPEERAVDQVDSTETMARDTVGYDTVTSTGSMSGSNGTGTDTTDTKRQKATRQAAEH